MQLLNDTFLGNTPREWIVAGATFAVLLALLLLSRRFLVSWLRPVAQRTESPVDDVLIDLLGRPRTAFIVVVALASASVLLRMPSEVRHRVRTLFILALIIQGALWANGLVGLLIRSYRKHHDPDDGDAATAATALSFISRLVLTAVFVLLLLDNLGINITALVAGLGVGGIAVALALQNLLGDLFAAFSIYTDKPFVVGDSIQVDQLSGTVERIGLRSTRIRSSGGEQLIIANTDMLKSRVRNFRRMDTRAIVFLTRLSYEMPAALLAGVPGLIREIIEGQKAVRFDRAHFRSYGEWALEFESAYTVLASDFNAYMDVQQAINYAIYDRFQAEGIAFALPTRRVELVGDAHLVKRTDTP